MPGAGAQEKEKDSMDGESPKSSTGECSPVLSPSGKLEMDKQELETDITLVILYWTTEQCLQSAQIVQFSSRMQQLAEQQALRLQRIARKSPRQAGFSTNNPQVDT